MQIPLVDMLYFGGTIILVIAVGIFAIRSMRSKYDGPSKSTNDD